VAELAPNGVKNATTDPAIIRSWWEKHPHANPAIAGGNGLAILDIDPDRGGWESLAKLEQEIGSLPDSWTVRTGSGGQHLYFSVPADMRIRNRTDWRPGLDIRGAGGYVIAPPSSHVLGGYAWLKLTGDRPPEASADLLACLKSKSSSVGKQETYIDNKTISIYVSSAPVSTATLQRIDDEKTKKHGIIQRQAVVTPGTRHLRLLNMSAEFNRLLELRGQPADFFLPYLYKWFDASKENIRANWHETVADWKSIWDSQDHSYRSPVEQAFEAAMAKPFPPIAARYKAWNMKRLIALAYELQATCAKDNGSWFLSCRTVADLLGVRHPWAWKCLYRLCCDGVLEKVEAPESETGWAHYYRVCAHQPKQAAA